jgi:hypothetical protein
MAKLKVNQTGFEAEADISVVGEMALKHLLKIIKIWWKNKKNKKNKILVEKKINNIRNLAFRPWRKYWRKFQVYDNFSLPQSEEQVKVQATHDFEHIYDPGHFKEFENRLDKEFAHHDLIQKFQEENGGKENFGVYLERAIKLKGFTMFPIRKVYTFSKKKKAVVILEEFRPFDNSYNIFVYCTKNWGNNILKK